MYLNATKKFTHQINMKIFFKRNFTCVCWLAFSSLMNLVVIVLCAVTLPSAAQARVYLDITSADLKKLPIAVPSFIDKRAPDTITEQGRSMAKLMEKALDLHGFISIIPPSDYQNDRAADWKRLGVDFVVLGSYDSDMNGMVLEVRFLDSHDNKMISGKRYRAPWSKSSNMVLKFADDIIYKLSGEAGISNTQIAFVSNVTGNKEVFITDILEENIRQVTRHRSLVVSPRFSPDGNQLAYTSYHRGNPNLYITNLLQSKTTKSISSERGLNITPAWSPDGKTLIATMSKDGNPDLYTLTTSGKVLKRLTNNEGLNVSASWAPDGKRFTFVSDRTGKPQIYIMDYATKRVRRLTYKGIENTTPSWSPKGDLIAYTGRVGGNHHLFTISPEGGQPTQLTKYWGNHESPSWAPDGRQLIFSRTRSEKRQLCRLSLKGGEITPTLLNHAGIQEFPQWSPRLEY